MTNAHGEDPARQRYYITTAIDYPNAPPHIGHSPEKVAADVVARYIAYKGTIPTLAAASTRIASTS